MPRFFVVQTLTQQEEVMPGEFQETVDMRLVPCEDTRAVLKAILKVRDADGGDWRLFEMVDGKARSRAVVFQLDGKVPYDVVVS